MPQTDFDVIPFESDQQEEQFHDSYPKVLERIEQSESEEQKGQLRNLARLVYERAQEDFFDQYTLDDLVGYLRHLRSQFEQFSEDSPLIDLVQPSMEEHGWQSPFSVFSIVTDDLPFVVDSLYELFRDLDLRVRYVLYNPVYLEWDSSNQLTTLEDRQEDSHFFASFHFDEIEPDKQVTVIQRVRSMMDDLVSAVEDFEPMLEEARTTRDTLQEYENYLQSDQHELLDEAREFLDYLIDGNFVFLGLRSYSLFEEDGTTMLQVESGSGRGVLRDEEDSTVYEPTPLDELDETYRERMQPEYLLVVSKSNTESSIYRRERMDYVGIKRLDEAGNIIGEKRFVGLFTNRVLAQPAVELPLLRQKFDQICEREELEEHSHTYRDFYSIFNGMPKHVLFMSSVDEIIGDIRAIIGVQGETKFKLRARPDLYQHGLSLMVLMSKDRFNQTVRKQIQQELRNEFDVDYVDYRLSLGEGNLARLHFHLSTDRRSPINCSFEELEHRLFQLTRTWSDRLQEQLNQALEKDRAHELFQQYETSFPTEFQALVSPELAVNDIKNLEQLRTEAEDPLLDLIQPSEQDYTHLVLYSRERIRLSDIMPVLSNHGLIVIDQSTFTIQPNSVDSPFHYHLFRIQDADEQPIDLENRKSLILDSIDGVLTGDYRDDRLNQLVTTEGLPPKTLNLFRLYKNYFHQLQPAIKLETINRILVSHDELAGNLFELFLARFRPDDRDQQDRESDQQEVIQQIETQLESVQDRTDDQVIRSLMDQILATQRTNYFQPNESRPYFSVKIACREVDEMPEPRPLYEIFVYSPYMEATHLRGGEVARGGIRWSDRRDDYRTEVLDLMKTQMVKNSLIVPVGSKGGFVLKTEHLSNEKSLEEHAREQYMNFMRGMLDLTDNIVDEEIIHPDNVVCYDGDDPYLVVAADKGTAHLSDTANQISEEYQFWLGDGFASGGSIGYDHKELGITAKGAWVNVKRHFRELGTNVNEEAITVAGIGDMGGDVFGNGLILSDNMKLQAAFNHLHIFLDPDPDLKKSFKERKRLFEQQAGWGEYDTDLISEGGGVFERSAKTIQLPEASRELLGLEGDEISPDEIIRAILKLDVDLLWNGGIGTFIKHSQQSHSEVGDPPNDAIRVDATEVRARVIGEGGNLGITQPGRIQLDQQGVRLNTDALDNSGGVDLSDHEVNLKILLKEAIRRDELNPDDREQTLMSLTEPVVDDVTYNNYRQSGAISLERRALDGDLEDIRQLLNELEESVELDREVENLPTERTLQEREQAGDDLTRPELAVLLSYVKMDLYSRSRGSEWSDDWVIERFMDRYLPADVPDQFPRAVKNHPLRREIALTKMINDIVDYTGVIFFHRLSNELVRPVTQIVRAYLAADDLLEGHRVRDMIEQMDHEVQADAQYDAFKVVRGIMANMVSWIIQTLPPQRTYETFVSTYKPLFDQHHEQILGNLDRTRIERLSEHSKRWQQRGFSEDFTNHLIDYKYALPTMDILVLHQRNDWNIDRVTDQYLSLGASLNIDWIMHRVFSMEFEARWDQLALRTMVTEVNELQRDMTHQLLEDDRTVDEFIEKNQGVVERLSEIRQQLERDRTSHLSAYHFMIQRIRSLLEIVDEA